MVSPKELVSTEFTKDQQNLAQSSSSLPGVLGVTTHGGSTVDPDVAGTQAGGGTNEDLKAKDVDFEALKAKGGEEPDQSTEKGTKRKRPDIQALKEKGGAEYIQHLEMMHEHLTDKYLSLKYRLFARETKIKIDQMERLENLKAICKKKLKARNTVLTMINGRNSGKDDMKAVD